MYAKWVIKKNIYFEICWNEVEVLNFSKIYKYQKVNICNKKKSSLGKNLRILTFSEKNWFTNKLKLKIFKIFEETH